jgi:hypothetical protein
MLTKLDRIARFEQVEEDLKHFKKVESLQEIYVGCKVYWSYQGKIRMKGVITREDQGYISDFKTIVERGVLFVRVNETTEEVQEVAKEQMEIKVKKEPPKKEPEQLSLF